MSIKIEMQKDAEEIMELMKENTGKKIQEIICEDIKNEVSKSSTMSIQNQEILEDESMLLTITID